MFSVLFLDYFFSCCFYQDNYVNFDYQSVIIMAHQKKKLLKNNNNKKKIQVNQGAELSFLSGYL